MLQILIDPRFYWTKAMLLCQPLFSQLLQRRSHRLLLILKDLLTMTLLPVIESRNEGHDDLLGL